MAFGSGAIGNGRSLREKKSMDEVGFRPNFLFILDLLCSGPESGGIQQRFAISGSVR